MPKLFSSFKNKENSNKKEKKVQDIVEKISGQDEPQEISADIESNKKLMQKLFSDVDVFVAREFENDCCGKKFLICFCDGVSDRETINNNIMKPLMLSQKVVCKASTISDITKKIIFCNEMLITKDIKTIIEQVSYGDTILFADGSSEAAIIGTKDFATRAIEEPSSDRSITGPKEGFNESILENLSLIRRKVRSNDLKMKYLSVGQRTSTSLCICYLDKIVNKSALKELIKRLNQIDIDSILETNYLSELIDDSKYSPFPTSGQTERPDVVIAKLLEGRVAVFLDGSPRVYTVPYLFIENFQSCEDYYSNYYYASFQRLIRILGFFLTISIPGIYILAVSFHQEMIPTRLLINISIERASVPLPAAAEAVIMLIVFDILRETGVRMPVNGGDALSIVGALVIGESAVAAKLVAAPMIIVVALTGITSLLIQNLRAPIIYIRFFVLFLSSTLGLFGFVTAIAITMIHILNLTSIGISQLDLQGNYSKQESKDFLVRVSWLNMKKRPKVIAGDSTRNRSVGVDENS